MRVEDVLNEARAEIGVKENPANSNSVKYNNWYYKKPVSGPEFPWCAVFVSWLFRNEQSLCKKTASCVDMLEWFTKNRQLVKNPHPGDIVFFKFNTNNRKTNHVGIVESVNGGVVTTIEGNTGLRSDDNGGCVMRRQRTTNIVAYAQPDYEYDTKTVNDVALEVIHGDWGFGEARKKRLTEAGYDYRTIQNRVNELLKRERE